MGATNLLDMHLDYFSSDVVSGVESIILEGNRNTQLEAMSLLLEPYRTNIKAGTS